MESKEEVRVLRDNVPELRSMNSGTSGRRISGTGIVFNSESRDLGGFHEVILPQALKGVIMKSDICAWLNHNQDRGILARCNKGVGTLDLVADSEGLKYSFEAPHTALGDELIENLKRGDISGSSFSFTVAKGGDSWTRKDGKAIRTISQFEKLFDVSPCYNPAYESTTVALRGLEAFKAAPVPAPAPVRAVPKKDATDMTPDQFHAYSISERKKLEDQLRKAQEDIRKYGYGGKIE